MASKKWECYEIEEGKIKDKKRQCPKCGSGVFLADHKDRWTCGNCQYTEFKS